MRMSTLDTALRCMFCILVLPLVLVVGPTPPETSSIWAAEAGHSEGSSGHSGCGESSHGGSETGHESGKGGVKGKGREGGAGHQPGASDHRGKGHSGGSKGLESAVLRGGGKVMPKGSVARMGRLNMAHAFLSPGFDPSKIDDSEAPLTSLDAYKTALEDRASSVTQVELAAYLSRVATASISGASISRLNEMLGVSSQFTATGISADSLAADVNSMVRESRGEEHE